MRMKEFEERFGLRGHYAVEREFLRKYLEKDVEVLAYYVSFVKKSEDEIFDSFKDWENPQIIAFIFRSARKLNGFVNGHDVGAEVAWGVITSMKVFSEVSEEASKAVFAKVL